MDRVGVEATNPQPVFLVELYYYLKGKSSYEKENLPPKCHPLHFFMTKNIKVRMNWQRVASHGGFHSTYAQIIEMLLDFYEKHRQQQKHDDNKKQA